MDWMQELEKWNGSGFPALHIIDSFGVLNDMYCELNFGSEEERQFIEVLSEEDFRCMKAIAETDNDDEAVLALMKIDNNRFADIYAEQCQDNYETIEISLRNEFPEKTKEQITFAMETIAEGGWELCEPIDFEEKAREMLEEVKQDES